MNSTKTLRTITRPMAALATGLAALVLATPLAAEGAPVDVLARKKWTDGKIDLEIGKTYGFTVSGEWIDWSHPSSAEGYTKWYLAPFNRLRRAPKARWFALIGCVERSSDHCFAITNGARIPAPASGRLYLFANDAQWFYWNNHGKLSVSVEAKP